MLAVSAVALVRLHATGGYLTARHALVPGTILTLAAASGLTWLTSKVSIPGRWLGLAHERSQARSRRLGGADRPAADQPLPSIAGAVPSRAVFGLPYDRRLARRRTPAADEEVLDLTDWSLYFSRRPGYHFADVYEAPADPKTRWIVVRKPNVEVDWHNSDTPPRVDRRPGAGCARFRPMPDPNQTADQHLRSSGRRPPLRRHDDESA